MKKVQEEIQKEAAKQRAQEAAVKLEKEKKAAEAAKV